jgi:hypothetical protein
MSRPLISTGDYWPALIAGDRDVVRAFAPAPVISYPPANEARGDEGLLAYLDATHRWLAEHDARWRYVATTTGASRVVDEGVLTLDLPAGEVALPVATAAELDGDMMTELRIYHSMWPLLGHHVVRPPLLKPSELPLVGYVAMYQDALARGDVDGVLAAFDCGGCAREPSGGPYLYCGEEALREFYAALFANSGGIGLEHCSMTDDDVRCAIEYNAVRWGKTPLAPQAGVAVYERGADGHLVAARIYDDVDPPAGA